MPNPSRTLSPPSLIKSSVAVTVNDLLVSPTANTLPAIRSPFPPDGTAVAFIRTGPATLEAAPLLRRVRPHLDAAPVGRGREVRQVTRGTRQQAHHDDGLLRGDSEAPLADAVAERAREPFAADFEVRRGDGARGPRRNRHRYRTTRRGAGVVNAGDRHLRVLRPRVDQPQPAHLVRIVAGVEDRHPPLAQQHRRDIVHRGQEPVVRADVGQHVDL